MNIKCATDIIDIIQACDLLDEYLGTLHYLDIDKYIDGPSKLFIATKETPLRLEMVGACTAGPLFDELDNFAPYFLLDHSNMAWVESVAVKPDYRGKGYGKALVKRAIEHCITISNEVVAMCWESPLDRQSLILFNDLGFEEVEHFKTPWAGDFCVICGFDCKCDATLVYRRFNA